MTLRRLDNGPALHEIFQSLDATQVLGFDGAIGCVKNVLSNALSIIGVFPRPKVILVGFSLGDWRGTSPPRYSFEAAYGGGEPASRDRTTSSGR